MLLEVEGLCVNYGHIEAIRDISFGVEEGEITTLIGANGAGKTTTLKTISGLRKVRQGKVVFDGKDITHLPSFERVKLGHQPVARGPRLLPGHDRPGEPRHGRLRPQRPQDRGVPRRTSSASSSCSRGSRSGSTSRPARCRAASSRCWRSAGR